MVAIKVYKTAEEARQQLEKYEGDNREAYHEIGNYSDPKMHEFHMALQKQTYFFVAELTAYVDDDYPGKFYFESTAYPFLGWDSLKEDICSLVKELKEFLPP